MDVADFTSREDSIDFLSWTYPENIQSLFEAKEFAQ